MIFCARLRVSRIPAHATSRASWYLVIVHLALTPSNVKANLLYFGSSVQTKSAVARRTGGVSPLSLSPRGRWLRRPARFAVACGGTGLECGEHRRFPFFSPG